MKTETIQVTVTRDTITGIKEARDLQDWCEQQPGLYCRITSHVDGGYRIEVGGVQSDELPVEFGDTVSWDGSQFTVTKAKAAP